MHDHSDLIDKLGGSGVIASALGLPVNVTSNWRVRGVSWQWRPKVAELAKKRRVPLPDGFLEPTTTKAAS